MDHAARIAFIVMLSLSAVAVVLAVPDLVGNGWRGQWWLVVAALVMVLSGVQLRRLGPPTADRR